LTTPATPTPPPAVQPPPSAPGGPTPDAADLWAAPAARYATDGPLRGIGLLLALAVTDPTSWFAGSPARLLLPVIAVGGAWLAAPAVAARPVTGSFLWYRRLLQQRNTAFAVACVLFAAAIAPPAWLACCDTGLLLTYLLVLDAVDGGPPAQQVLHSPLALLAAYGSGAAVLAAALLPAPAIGSWGRLLAAAALVATAASLAAALLLRRRSRP
jgi:hypothetical protein